jgi:hypothetical protein
MMSLLCEAIVGLPGGGRHQGVVRETSFLSVARGAVNEVATHLDLRRQGAERSREILQEDLIACH